MIRCLILLLLAASIAEARVTFQSSEVLQESDFISSKRVSFRCINGCKLYTDSRSPDFFVSEFSNDTQEYKEIVSFANMNGRATNVLKAYELPHSKDYFVEYRCAGIAFHEPFVFYALDAAVDDSHSTVRVLTDNNNIVIGSTQGKVTRVTVLSSKYATVTYSHYGGAYTPGYPRIFATGPDAVHNCNPVYHARDLENVRDSAITVFSPISTFDFGSMENHSVNVTFNKYGTIAHEPKSSVVYSSPGYVGCPYINTQSYTNPAYTQTVTDSFTMEAKSLIINADLELPGWSDAVLLTVNNEKMSIYRPEYFNKVFNDTNYTVDIKWRKNTPGANFAMQLDFDWYLPDNL